MGNNFDVDSLLSQGAQKKHPKNSPKTSSSKKNSSSLDVVALSTSESEFRVDSKEASRLLNVDPENFHNPLKDENSRKKRKISYYVAGGAAFVLAVLAVLYLNLPHTEVYNPSSVANSTSQRFLNLLPNAPMPNTTEASTVVVKDSYLQIPDGYQLYFPNAEFEVTGFKAIAATDFGLAATISGKENANLSGTQIYLFKDMVRSKVFASATNANILNIPGSAAAVSMDLDLFGEAHPILAIVNPDSTGFMIVLPSGTPSDVVDNLARTVAISNTSQ